MTANGYFQIGFYLVVLLALAPPLGWYMAQVYEGKQFGLDRVLGWLKDEQRNGLLAGFESVADVLAALERSLGA